MINKAITCVAIAMVNMTVVLKRLSRGCARNIFCLIFYGLSFLFIQMDGLYYGLLQTRCGSGLDLVFVSFVISLLCMEIISLGLACLLSADENQHGVKNTKQPKYEIQSIIHSVRSAGSLSF